MLNRVMGFCWGGGHLQLVKARLEVGGAVIQVGDVVLLIAPAAPQAQARALAGAMALLWRWWRVLCRAVAPVDRATRASVVVGSRWRRLADAAAWGVGDIPKP